MSAPGWTPGLREFEKAKALACKAVAAQDLYEALEGFCEAFSNCGETTSLHAWNQRLKAADARARPALAKARGEPS